MSNFEDFWRQIASLLSAPIVNVLFLIPNSNLLLLCFLPLQKKFVAKNEKLVKTFGMYKKFEDSQQFLVENPSLVCEDTSNYLVIWCVNLACEEVRFIRDGQYRSIGRGGPTIHVYIPN